MVLRVLTSPGAKYVIFPLLSLVSLGGCTAPCEGAACGDLYPRASVGVFDAGALAAEEVDPRAPDVSIEGGDDDGYAWALVGGEGGVLVGVPDAEELRWYDADAVATGAEPDAISGEGAGARFGASAARITWEGEAGLLVGAPDHAAGAITPAAGAVLRYTGLTGEGLTGATGPVAAILGENAEDHLGEGVWACGDLDGDGQADWAASAPWAGAQGSLAGALYLGLSASMPAGDAVSAGDLPHIYGVSDGAAFGTDVVCDTSFDGDDLPELVVGAPYTNVDGEDGAGAVYAWRGDAGLAEPGAAVLTATGHEAGEYFGAALARGDLDGDGLADLVVGAPGRDAPGQDGGVAGAVYVFTQAALGDRLRQPTLTPDDPAPAITLRGEFARGRFGASVAVADFDGDGADDLAIGAPGTNRTGAASATRAGMALVWWGPLTDAAGLARDADVVVAADRQYLETGSRLGAADVDGDGASELLVLTRQPADEE